eukprot:TRINITY_DN276_c1_g1_i12.p2 TRINITY_DN276_c1_g1~~TRINITY_DN276_c1_g1_i12.p2  ORF type:complete len:621 (+),score=236.20 TRINITY_DN276_c1_g1_i12:85-1947(+)
MTPRPSWWLAAAVVALAIPPAAGTSPGALFAKFIPTFGTDEGQNAPGAAVTLESPDGPLMIDVTESAVEADGRYMAANGRVHGSAGKTDFMMKGTNDEMYGWVTFDDEGRALEYTTADGAVEVAEVPLEKIKTVCEIAEAGGGGRDAAVLQEAHEQSYQGQDLRRLQSLPGSSKVFFLDLSQMFQNAVVNDDLLWGQKAMFYEMWMGVSAGFSAFDLNVVTDPAVFNAAAVSNRGHACFINADGRSNAWLNSFGTTRCSTNYRQKSGYTYARITLHEIGHQFGLSHDGQEPGTGAYFHGIPEYRWVPVMGNVFFGDGWGANALYQWSLGEYLDANQRQDDLQLIEQYVRRRGDDIDTVPLVVTSSGAVTASQNRGAITDRSDSDTFTFAVGGSGGRVRLQVDRTEYLGGAMLDVDATLRAADGRTLARSNPVAVRSASIDVSVPAGSYALVVRGGAEGTPQWGFSTYSSLGLYAITGSITGALPPPPATPAPPPTPPPTPPPPTPGMTVSLRMHDADRIALDYGTITDGFDPTYPNGRDYSVTVVGDSCRVEWTSFDLEASENCEWDYVTLSAGGDTWTYCGGELPPAQTLRGAREFSVTFYSDAAVVGAGFDLVYACTE